MRVLIVSSPTAGYNAAIMNSLLGVGVNASVHVVASTNFRETIPLSEVRNATNSEEACCASDDILAICKAEKAIPLFNLRPNPAMHHDITLLQAYVLVATESALTQAFGMHAIVAPQDARQLATVFHGAGHCPSMSVDVPEALLQRSPRNDVPYAARMPSPSELHARSFL